MDGFRCLALKLGDTVRLESRNDGHMGVNRRGIRTTFRRANLTRG